jgi:hypothetical protein
VIERPRFAVSVQYMVRVYCVLFTSYLRFSLVINGDLLISAARGRLEPEVMSPFDRLTMVPYKCSLHTTIVYHAPIDSYIRFFRLLVMVEPRFRPLGGLKTGSDVTK